MSSAILNKAGKKLFEQHLHQYQPADPLYESYTDARGRQKRKKRELPPGLSARDAKILTSVKRRAHYLDKGFRIAGMRFGWTFIIGIIPGAGDAADAALNYILVVRKARQADLPAWLVRRMLANNLVSVAAGLLPVAGDVVLAMFKANSRNAALLEEFLRIRGEEFLKLKAEQEEKKAKGTGAVAASDKDQTQVASEQDLEQVKPGAGRVTGEVVPGEGATSGGSEKKVGSKSKSFSWRGSGKKKWTQLSGDRGKFVEDVTSSSGEATSSSSGGGGGGGGTLKKKS